MQKYFLIKAPGIVSWIIFSICITMVGCSDPCANMVEDIHISSPARNTLKIQIDVHTAENVDVYVKYWPKGNTGQSCVSAISRNNVNHKLRLTNLSANQEYAFRVVASGNNCLSESKAYSFATTGFPMWMKDMFSVICPDTTLLPAAFRKGYTLLYCKENPGLVFLLNAGGKVVWYHQVNGTGFKMAHFTKHNTILALLGSDEYPTSYGNEILELSLSGDTLFHVKKGERDLNQTIHHEVLLDDKNHLVTICSEDRIIDLTAKGGNKTDTVKGDGILVLDKQGKQVWKWTVFDVLNPLTDKDIIKNKSDWMHANSLNMDDSGNYLLSFYNTGQIWKIDGKTGKLLWRFGKGGDFSIPAEAAFDQCHAVHLTRQNNLMFFDNGVPKQVSRAMIFSIDEKQKKASLVLNTPLPHDVYNERMGSAYLVSDTALLYSCSKKNTVVLTNAEGRFIWALKTRFSPYRAEFIPAEWVKPYIMN